MNAEPFGKPKLLIFLRRQLVLSILVLFFGILGAGLFFQSPFLKGSTPLVLIGENKASFHTYLNEKKWPLSSAWDLYHETWSYFFYGPRVCTQGSEVNDFQREQCREYYYRLGARGVTAFFPLFLLGLFLTVSKTVIRLRYYRANQVLLSKRKSVMVRVCETSPKSLDLFAYFHCLHQIRVELPDKKKALAYYSTSEVLPLKGDKLAYALWGTYHGKKRYVATPHAPHIEIRKA